MPTPRLHRILVAIADPEASGRRAIARARELSLRTGARIELFNAIPLPVSPGRLRAAGEQFVRFEAERNARALERLAARLRSDGCKADVRLETGYPPAEAIMREARRYRADLVMIEARKHGFLARLLLGATDVDLIRRSALPLLIVKSGARWRRPRVLAALDPSAANRKPPQLDHTILRTARAVAAWSGGSVQVAHVYPAAPRLEPGERIDLAAIASIPAREKAYAASVLRRLRKECARHGIAARNVHIACGDPADELPRIARGRRANVVLMGGVSRSGILGFLIESMPEITLGRFACDLLIVPARRPAAEKRA